LSKFRSDTIFPQYRVNLLKPAEGFMDLQAFLDVFGNRKIIVMAKRNFRNKKD
jgi:hypothetical protein